MVKKYRKKPTVTVKKCDITSHQCCILSAVFAVTNMGHPTPSVEKIKRLKDNPNIKLPAAVNLLSEPYTESDDDLEMFGVEALMWEKEFKERTWDEVKTLWPNKKEVYELLTAK